MMAWLFGVMPTADARWAPLQMARLQARLRWRRARKQSFEGLHDTALHEEEQDIPLVFRIPLGLNEPEHRQQQHEQQKLDKGAGHTQYNNDYHQRYRGGQRREHFDPKGELKTILFNSSCFDIEPIGCRAERSSRSYGEGDDHTAMRGQHG
jgi:hypothetical protein